MTRRQPLRPARSALILASALLCASACASTAPAEAGEAITLDSPAVALEGTRYLEVRVGATLDAPPEAVWAVLTDGSRYTEWNSTLITFEGTVAEGETVRLVAKTDPDRSFELAVSGVRENAGMVWSDGGRAFRGERTFTLEPVGDGQTAFTMKEVFTGSMMGMIAPKLPDFRPAFDDFARDLGAEAARVAAAQ